MLLYIKQCYQRTSSSVRKKVEFWQVPDRAVTLGTYVFESGCLQIFYKVVLYKIHKKHLRHSINLNRVAILMAGTLLKETDFSTGGLLWFFQNFSDHLFCRTLSSYYLLLLRFEQVIIQSSIIYIIYVIYVYMFCIIYIYMLPMYIIYLVICVYYIIYIVK